MMDTRRPIGDRWRSTTGGAAPEGADWSVWMDGAACRGAGTGEFFGPGMATGQKRCRCCPVIEVCFWWAIVAEADLGYHFGVWGGASPAVRAQVASVTGVPCARLGAAAADWAEGSLRGAREPIGARP